MAFPSPNPAPLLFHLSIPALCDALAQLCLPEQCLHPPLCFPSDPVLLQGLTCGCADLQEYHSR